MGSLLNYKIPIPEPITVPTPGAIAEPIRAPTLAPAYLPAIPPATPAIPPAARCRCVLLVALLARYDPTWASNVVFKVGTEKSKVIAMANPIIDFLLHIF